jgi:hypothetical protein
MSSPEIQAAFAAVGQSISGISTAISRGNSSSYYRAAASSSSSYSGGSSSSYSSAASEAQRLADEFARLRESLIDFRRELISGELAQLSPEAAYAAARAQYESTAQLARLGNTEALGDLEGVSRDFLRASQNYYAASAGYFSDRDAVLAAIEEAIGVTSRHAGLAVPQFAAGGWHAGGVRLVGERGPELEVTGPARYFDAETTRRMLSSNNEGETPRLLRDVLMRLDALVRQGGEVGTTIARHLTVLAAQVDEVATETRRNDYARTR